MKTINMEYLNAQHDFFLCALIALFNGSNRSGN